MEKAFYCNAERLDKNMTGKEVEQLYLQSFADGREKGYTPVVVFVNDTLESVLKIAFETEVYTKSVLSNDHTNGKELLDERYAELEEFFGDEALSADMNKLDAILSTCENSDRDSFMPSASYYEGQAYLVRVPTTKPYEVFAWIPFGGWNECPDADDMIAICKYWYDNYGAVPSTITLDTLSFYLEKPVASKETALNIAKEQCAFCSEILDLGGVEDYAAMTYNGCSWFFWWD